MRTVRTIATGLVCIAAAASCLVASTKASSLDGPDYTQTWVLEGWSDPRDAREAVYFYAPEGACEAHMEGKVVVVTFDCQ